jgi:hypothetical protein
VEGGGCWSVNRIRQTTVSQPVSAPNFFRSANNIVAFRPVAKQRIGKQDYNNKGIVGNCFSTRSVQNGYKEEFS